MPSSWEKQTRSSLCLATPGLKFQGIYVRGAIPRGPRPYTQYRVIKGLWKIKCIALEANPTDSNSIRFQIISIWWQPYSTTLGMFTEEVLFKKEKFKGLSSFLFFDIILWESLQD